MLCVARKCIALGSSLVTQYIKPRIIQDATVSPGCTRADTTIERLVMSTSSGSVTHNCSTGKPDSEWHSTDLVHSLARFGSSIKASRSEIRSVRLYGTAYARKCCSALSNRSVKLSVYQCRVHPGLRVLQYLMSRPALVHPLPGEYKHGRMPRLNNESSFWKFLIWNV